ncbi:DNRLRE domain-containing protein [Inediibacterium massiliense]|uniref:DNRLRE domain-containing protein n=1 Tax=Inediibacterium massiliense TaxID=1658111 RepID=UPI0006B45BD8|nr:DNRLRE domain-containing protein [Inediibacterium massiliense]
MVKILEQSPKKNTTINSFMTYENYKDYYALFLGKYMDDSVYRCLLEFSLPILVGKGTVEKVELLLYVIRNDDQDVIKQFQVHRIKEKFYEDQVSYSNQPPIDEKICSTFEIKDEIDTYIKVDITKLFSDWYTKKYSNHGLLLKSSNESQNSLVSFYNKGLEDGLHGPKMKIYYKQNHENIYSKSNKNIDIIKEYEKLSHVFHDEIYECKKILSIVMELEKIKEYDKALELIDKVIRYYPDFTDLIYKKGEILKIQNKFLLAIEAFQRCIEIGEGPLSLNFITGTGNVKSFVSLANIYFKLEDYEKAYVYCIKALQYNKNSIHNLALLYEILYKQKREMEDIKNKLENYMDNDLSGTNYIILGKVFMREKNYKCAYEYFLKAEEYLKDTSILFYDKGMCLLFLKDYHKAYDSFKKVNHKEYKEEAIYKMFLCKVLEGRIDEGSQILYQVREPENNLKYIVYDSFKRILKDEKPYIFDKEQSKKITDSIFELLDILIEGACPDIFEKSLNMLNIIDDDEVLLKLAKLYDVHGFYDMAYKEFIRSIKIFEKIDMEGIQKMENIFLKRK